MMIKTLIIDNKKCRCYYKKLKDGLIIAVPTNAKNAIENFNDQVKNYQVSKCEK